MIFCRLLIFSKLTFSKNSFSNTIRVLNSLDPDQAPHRVRPDLSPNCLQRISAKAKELKHACSVCVSHYCLQSVTCLAPDASLTIDPGVASSIPARSHTFEEIDHEIMSTVILHPSAESFKITSESMCTKYWLTACSSLPRKKCG